MRILVLNWLDRENPLAGGAEAHLHQTFGRLAGRGHEVTALVSGWSGAAPRAELDGISVHRTGSRYTFSAAAPRYYRRHLASEPFDIVVEDLNKVPLFTPYWSDKPLLLLVHHLFGLTAFQAASFPVALMTVLLERPLSAVYAGTPAISVSESTRDDLEARGLRRDNISVVPNGIDVEHYAPDPSVPKAVRPTLLFLGRLKKYKRVDLVIEAVARLAEQGIDVEFLIAGSGDQMEELSELTDLLGVADRVRFLGYVSEEEKVDLMRRAWVHVLTSPKEGWGITNLEAGACGTPTVASDAPGLRESVVHGETGLLVPHEEEEALVEALARLVQDPELRDAMGRKARAYAERFTWEATADGVEQGLERVVAGQTRR